MLAEFLEWMEDRRVRKIAERWVDPPIREGEWLLDLGMATPRAVRIKRAYELQQESRTEVSPE